MDKYKTLVDLFQQNKDIRKWQQDQQKRSRSLLLGLSSSTKAITMATVVEDGHKVLVLTSSQNEAERLASDLLGLLGEEKVYLFLGDDNPLAEFVFASQERVFSRLEALDFLLAPEKEGIVIANVSGSRLLLPNPKTVSSMIQSFSVGEERNLTELKDTLLAMGYQKVSQVSQQGEFSLRGDIVDLFEASQDFPYRLEFFGDEIDGIRTFSPETQRSLENLDAVIVHPVSDMLLTKDDFLRGQKNLENLIQKSPHPEFKSYLTEILTEAHHQRLHADSRKFLSLFYQQTYTLFDYLPKHAPLFLDDYHKIMDQEARFDLDVANLLTEDLQKSRSFAEAQYFADNSELLRTYKPASYFQIFKKAWEICDLMPSILLTNTPCRNSSVSSLF